MSDLRKEAVAYAHQNHERFLDELIDVLKIPSVSTDPAHKNDMQMVAQWLADQLKTIGMKNVTIFPTPRHPVVYAEYLPHETAPTVLIYGHYDVQPAEPLELWKSDPFIPEKRGENLFARGASDMKGQVIASIKAVESILKQGEFPINIKFILEGEEEIGSPNLPPFMEAHKDLLACDLALNPDSGMVSADIPTIVYALRGLAYFELRVYGPAHDLHSGVFGGIIHNPAQALCEIIAGMHDSNGRITLPGFYDHVRPLEDGERKELSRLPLNDAYFLEQTGSPDLYGEKGYTSMERVSARPTLDVNGFLSGFTGEGSKTVIPAWAMAKISMRLVPDQSPEEVYRQLCQYLEDNAPKSIRWELIQMQGGSPCITDTKQPGSQALSLALESVWGVKPIFKREGGSIPVVADMQKYLGADSVLTGFGLPDDNIHAPNEKLHLPTWYKGIDALIEFFYNMA